MNRSLIAVAGLLAFTGLLEAQPAPLRVTPEIQEQRIVYRVSPVYPNMAKQAHIQGTVVLAARIGRTGRVEWLQLVSGHPLLVSAAMNAVKRWRYRPAFQDGMAAPVLTTISITFALGPPFDSGGAVRV